MRYDDDTLKDLEAALSITPSPEFATRVRARVAVDSHRAPGTRVIWWIGATATVAAGVVMAVVVRPSVRHNAVVAAIAPAPNVASLVAVPPKSEDETQPRISPVERVQPSRASRLAQARVENLPPLPKPLVPDDERLALNRLLLAVREGRATVPGPLPGPALDEDGNLLEPPAIDIPLITIKLLPGTPVDGSGSKKK